MLRDVPLRIRLRTESLDDATYVTLMRTLDANVETDGARIQDEVFTAHEREVYRELFE